MKIKFRIGMFLIIVCLIVSCDFSRKSLKSKDRFSLTIVLDSRNRYKAYYGKMYLVTGNDSLEYDSVMWNKNKDELTYKWDSLKSGEYQFKIKTIYHHPKDVSISLKTDTIIKIQNDFSFQFVNSIPKNVLLQVDTIDFAFESNGCSFTIDKYLLVRDSGKYRLIRSKNYRYDSINKVVKPEIIDDLYEMQLKCKKYNIDRPRSTRSYQFIMIAGQKAFYFNDNYSVGSIFFETFVDKYAIN